MDLRRLNEFFENLNKFLLYSFAVASIVFDGGSTVLALRIGLTEGNKYTGAVIDYFGPNLGLAITIMGKLVWLIVVYKLLNWAEVLFRVELQKKNASSQEIELGSLIPKLILACVLFINVRAHFLAAIGNVSLILRKI